LIILGIDPGSRYCGYGLLQTEKRKIVAAGCDRIKLKANLSLADRLAIIYEEILKLIEEYKPDVASIETIFFGKNIKSAFTLGHARGVILLPFAQKKIPIAEYSPREVKQAVVGNGNASKSQVHYMINQILGNKFDSKPEDAIDALAIAICHFNKEKFRV